jgi:hypothetical protein
VKQWDDDKEWYKKNENAHLLNRKLFGMDGEVQEGHDGKYGLGNIRTLRDYEKYTGLLFEKRAVQDYTLQKHYPPNPDFNTEEEWSNSFLKEFKYEIILNKEDFSENDYDFLAVTFHDSSNKEIYRQDADYGEIKKILKDNTPKIKRKIQTNIKPKTWSVWFHSKSKEWVKQKTGQIK